MHDGDYDAAIRLDELAASIGEARGDRLLVALAKEKQGLVWSWRGDLEKATQMYRAAVAEFVDLGLHRWALIAWTNLADILIEMLDIPGALAECEAARAVASKAHADALAARLDAQEAVAHWRSGDLVRARELAGRAYQQVALPRRAPAQIITVVALIHAGLAIDCGDLAAASPAVAVAEEMAREEGFESFAFEARFCRAGLAACEREPDRVDEHLANLEIDEPLSMARLALFVSRLHVTSPTPNSEHELKRLTRVLVPDSSPYAGLAAGEIAATRQGIESGDERPVLDAVEAWQRAGLELDAMRCLLVGAFIARSGDRVDAAGPLFERARLGLLRCGARGDATRAAKALRELGRNVSVRTEKTTSLMLTPRELDVAWHVARGLRNAEVAERLQVTEHAVKRHLNRAYRKLEISSRTQLAVWVREQAPAHPEHLAVVDSA